MAKRHRRFKNTYEGLSPHSVWILTGILLGYVIPYLPKEKRKAYIITRLGKKIQICYNSVSSLVTRKALIVDVTNNRYAITSFGFDQGIKRLSQSGLKVKDQKLTDAQKKKVAETTSSTSIDPSLPTNYY
jgi:hypothetical protein